MAVVDRESLVIEERAARAWATSLGIEDSTLLEAKHVPGHLSVKEAVDRIGHLDLATREMIFQGLLTITVSDSKVPREEQSLAACLATRWNLGEDKVRFACLLAQSRHPGILEFLE